MSKAFGEQNPTQGETAVSWQTFSNGSGSIPTVVGNADWGKLGLWSSGGEGRSAVYDLGSSITRTFKLSENRYGTGSGSATLQIRGDASSFLQDATSPLWENYSSQISRTWRYVQIREIYNSLLLSASSNGRYLKNSANNPVLLLGDSPQGILVTRSTSDFATYFSARKNQGFNYSQVHIIAGPTFGGGANFETYDGIHPFTVDGDISTPNNTYFNKLDTLVTTAATYDIVLMLNAAEMIDFNDGWRNNGNTKCYNWGVYLGNRYKNNPNIIWMVGNDFQDWTIDTNSVTALINVINGIQSVDGNHLLYTMWLDYYVSASRDSSDFNAECTLDLGYTYYISYDKIGTEYALSPAKPVFLGESCYQDDTAGGLLGTPLIIRNQNYWAMLAGACGTTVMNSNFQLNAGWDTQLTTKECFTQIIHLKNLFTAHNWYNLIPDTTNTVLTAGYGTKRTGTVRPDTNDYANCAYIEGSLAIIYMAQALTMTVDMTHFTSNVTCRWYDPTNGQYYTDAASPVTNSGTHQFSRADANSAGDHDWILELKI